MAKKDICKYAPQCPIYQGKELENINSLVVYKNVFCERGPRGWNNCKQFLIFKNGDPGNNS